jgi:capsule polysaccharide export protein KpsE/RkpR
MLLCREARASPLLCCGRAQASDAVSRVPQLQTELAAVQARYVAAVELVGERDERLEELSADLADVKALYKQDVQALYQQIEALAAQLAAAAGGGAAAASG